VPLTADPKGPWTTIDGNLIGALLTAFIIDQTKARGRLRPNQYVITTLVTSQMAGAIAERAGVRVVDDLLVGFKWIGQRIDQLGPAGFLFGFEESHGYLKGTHCRDKDAAVAALLFAELAAELKARGQTVLEYLDTLFLTVGHYGDRLINKTLEGREGAAQIETLMEAFREKPARTIGGVALTEVYDYKSHEIRPLGSSGAARPLPQPSGDMLIFHTAAPGTRFAVRPSGTEPKIKFYLFARTATDGLSRGPQLEAAKAKTATQLDRMARDLEQYIAAALQTTAPAH
jgi:phosphoglucomutase